MPVRSGSCLSYQVVPAGRMPLVFRRTGLVHGQVSTAESSGYCLHFNKALRSANGR